MDSIFVVLSKSNGVDNISTAQLIDILEGKATNWQELGGSELAIFPSHMNPYQERGMVLLFEEFIVGENGMLAANARPGDNPSMLGHYR